MFELGGKPYSYLIYGSSKDKKAKGTKICVTKKRKFGSCPNCLEATQLENEINH